MLSLLDEQLFLVRMGTFLLILCGGLIGFFFLNRIINRREAVQENRWMPEQDLPVDYDEADGELDWEEAEEEYEEEEYLDERYGYEELYADDPEPWDSYDSYAECEEYQREVTDEERW